MKGPLRAKPRSDEQKLPIRHFEMDEFARQNKVRCCPSFRVYRQQIYEVKEIVLARGGLADREIGRNNELPVVRAGKLIPY